MQSWSSAVCLGCAQCSHRVPGSLRYAVHAELDHKRVFLFSHLSQQSGSQWETCCVQFGIGVFFSGKEESPNWRGLTHPDFPFVFTEIWRQYGFIAATSPSCNCFSMDSCSGQGRNPASLLSFSLCAVIPARRWPRWPPACPTRDPTGLFWGGGHTGKPGSRHTGMAQPAPTILLGAATSPVENPSSSQAPAEKALGSLPRPGKLCWTPWLSRQPRCLLAAGQCQEQFPAPSWIYIFF